jgi:hypothetical protein
MRVTEKRKPDRTGAEYWAIGPCWAIGVQGKSPGPVCNSPPKKKSPKPKAMFSRLKE